MNNARAARSLLQAGADKDAQDSRVRPGSRIAIRKKKKWERETWKAREHTKPIGAGPAAQQAELERASPMCVAFSDLVP